MLTDIIKIVLLIIGLYLLVSGIIRIVRRKHVKHKWKYAGKHYAEREDKEVSGLSPIINGIIRVIIAIILFSYMTQI